MLGVGSDPTFQFIAGLQSVRSIKPTGQVRIEELVNRIDSLRREISVVEAFNPQNMVPLLFDCGEIYNMLADKLHEENDHQYRFELLRAQMCFQKAYEMDKTHKDAFKQANQLARRLVALGVKPGAGYVFIQDTPRRCRCIIL